MIATWRWRSESKAGSAAGENEDALAVDEAAGRAAVCDGASEGWASGPWAAALARAFVADPPQPPSFEAWLAAARTSAAPAPAAASWYAEEKQAQGAFSTLLGFSLSPARDGGTKFHAVAVGDTALFQLRGGGQIACFPLEDSAMFSNVPNLVGSVPEAGLPEPEWFAGRAEPGDRFYVATDALAEWCLREHERGGCPWPALDAALESDAAFAEFVGSLRRNRAMKNDDATLLGVHLVGN